MAIVKDIQNLTEQQLKALAKLEKWFSDRHEQFYSNHQKLAKAKDGFMCKILECGMGAHDSAWAEFSLMLMQFGISTDQEQKWRKQEISGRRGSEKGGMSHKFESSQT